MARVRGVTLLIAIASVASGCCVSRTHLGFLNLGNQGLWNSVVGKRFVEPLRDQEDLWMTSLARLDLVGLSTDFAPTLASHVNEGQLRKLAVQMERDYHPSGYFMRQRFGTPALSWGRGARRDAFGYYDMVGYAYTMEGKVSATAEFYLTRVGDGGIKICGIVVTPQRESDREKAKDVRLVFPETQNKSDVVIRPGMLMRRSDAAR
jgi:hypothetical protein